MFKIIIDFKGHEKTAEEAFDLVRHFDDAEYSFIDYKTFTIKVESSSLMILTTVKNLLHSNNIYRFDIKFDEPQTQGQKFKRLQNNMSFRTK